MKLWRYTVSTAIVVTLIACGWRSHPTEKGQGSPPGIHIRFIAEPGCLDRSIARITIVEQPPGCSVQQSNQKQVHDVPCQVVGGYIRQALNPPRGSMVGISVRGRPSSDLMQELFGNLSAHGFEAGSTQCFVSTSDDHR